MYDTIRIILRVLYTKKECRKKEMCINEANLLEIEALVGKTLVHRDKDFNVILMQVRRQNLEKKFLFQLFLLDLKPIHTSFIVLKIYL